MLDSVRADPWELGRIAVADFMVVCTAEARLPDPGASAEDFV